ncbi:hypothetical protein AMECASPLE_021655, partial [Ameca splendens]
LSQAKEKQWKRGIRVCTICPPEGILWTRVGGVWTHFRRHQAKHSFFQNLLSCWKVNLHPSLKSFADSFSSRIVLYLAPSIFPSTLTTFPVPAEEKQPQA